MTSEAHLPEEVPFEITHQIDELNERAWDALQSNPRGALRIALEATRAAEQTEYRPGLAAAHLNSGWAQIRLGAYDESVAFLTNARQQFTRLGDTAGVAKSINALGVLAFRIGEYEQAGEFLSESLRLAVELDDADRRIAALNNLAELSAAAGDYVQALHRYAEASELAALHGDAATEAVIRVNIGRVHLEQGKADTAIVELQEALERSSGARDRVTEAEAMTQLARALVLEAGGGDPDGTAEELHLQSIALCEELDHPAGLTAALENLAALLIAVGRVEEAELHLERAIAICLETNTRMTCLPVLEELSAQYELRGDAKRALLIARWLLSLQEKRAGADTSRRIRALRAGQELDEARLETEVVRLRNVELREKSEALERLNATLQLLHLTGSELTSTLEFEEIGRRLHERLNELMSADVFGIAIYREADDLLDFALVIENDQRLTPFTVPVSSEDSFGGWVVRNREEICLNDADRLHSNYVLHRKPFTARDCRSIVFIPLEVDARIVGVLTVQSHRRNMYNSEKMAILRLLAPYIAVALDNARKLNTIQELNRALEAEKDELEDAYRRIAHMANHDILTGLPNRRLLVELLHEHIPLARRQSRVFGLLYVDLDEFKPVNDTYGHETGDQVLVIVADRLRRALRESDTVARIGGDEFVIIVREATDGGDVAAVADKVHSVIIDPVVLGGKELRIAASIGMSLYPRDGESYDELLGAADDAMYRSKELARANASDASQAGYRSRTFSSDESIESPSNTNRPST